MMVKPFSAALKKQILDAIDTHLARSAGPHFAAFDADGTLWDSDVGENFFQYQIDFCNLPALKNLDPWKHYLDLKKQHPPDAYRWLAELCDLYPVEQVRSWAQESLQKFPLKVLEPQKELISDFLKRNIQVFIVSASTHWAVEASASVVGLPASSALGVTSAGTVTWREGNRVALLEKTKGVAPLFCSGNSSGDIHLLECASLLRLAVQTQLPNSQHANLFQDEQKLLALAQERGWPTHHFYG
ncbi:haloacid dehalogenase-like hydrolase [bacterium]|nr:haloacid dehalogenase-like hydrolase [bacterium]